MVTREVLDTGLRLITESMPHVRSVSLGVWLTRGSRHETGRPRRHRPFRRAHALQGHRHAHRRGHRPGDRLHRRPARRVHGQGIRQLLHQGPRRAPADRGRPPVRHRDEPAASTRRISTRRRRSSSKRSRWSRTRPTTSSTSSSRSISGKGTRSAGRSSGRKEIGGVLHRRRSCATISATSYVAPNLIVSAAGNVEHARVRDLVARAFETLPSTRAPFDGRVPRVVPQVLIRVQGARAEPRLSSAPTAIRRTTRTATSATS